MAEAKKVAKKSSSIDERIKPAVFDVLSPDASVKSRTSFGGTAPDNVLVFKDVAKPFLEHLADTFARRRSGRP